MNGLSELPATSSGGAGAPGCFPEPRPAGARCMDSHALISLLRLHPSLRLPTRKPAFPNALGPVQDNMEATCDKEILFMLPERRTLTSGPGGSSPRPSAFPPTASLPARRPEHSPWTPLWGQASVPHCRLSQKCFFQEMSESPWRVSNQCSSTPPFAVVGREKVGCRGDGAAGVSNGQLGWRKSPT